MAATAPLRPPQSSSSSSSGGLREDCLAGERKAACFDVEALAAELAGGKAALERKRKAIAAAVADPVLSELQQAVHVVSDRREVVKNFLKLMHRIRDLQRTEVITSDLAQTLLFACGLPNGGLDLHAGVFVPSLRSMAAPEQAEVWVPKASKMEWIGCYAQTELSHGSNVRGLQTTATFIPQDDEFEIHTPNLGAYKWWPGALGVLSTHCLVYARLIVAGVDHGIHNFLVPIRSLEDHSALPGVKVGDIGPKMGINSNDNGFVAFDRVRIPRFNMLARFAHVTKAGVYEKRGAGGAGVYTSMTAVRGNIAAGAFRHMASAATIAVRFCCSRRQEPGKSAGNESPILDYTSVQWRILPQVATAYALRFLSSALFDEIHGLSRRIAEDPSSAVFARRALHATTCALKSYCTALTADGIEECRRACGGHGFINASGLPKLYGDYFTFFTPEGDNWLLTQQTSSIVLRILQELDGRQSSGSQWSTPSLAYLLRKDQLLSARCEANSVEALVENIGKFADAFEHRAVWLWKELALTQSGLGKAAHSATLVEQFQAAQAHGLAALMRYQVNSLEELMASRRLDDSTLLVLKQLAALFAVVQIQRACGDFLCSGWLTPMQAKLLQPAARHLCALLRPQAVPLVDAFDKSDFELNSAIGSWDGRYEERLIEMAQREPLNARWNAGSTPDEYWQYLKPVTAWGMKTEGGAYGAAKL